MIIQFPERAVIDEVNDIFSYVSDFGSVLEQFGLSLLVRLEKSKQFSNLVLTKDNLTL